MFVAPWNIDMTPGRLVAPISVRRDFQASPQWFAKNPGAMDAVGDALLSQNEGIIQSWLQAQRQNARNAVMEMWTANLVLPGITVQYWNYSGSEILRLIATPENASTSTSSSLTIPLEDVIDVTAPFLGYPIPGYPNDLDLLVTDLSTQYYWDFASTPGAPGLDRPIDEFGDGNTPWPQLDWRAISAGSHVIPVKLTGKVYWEVEVVALPNEPSPQSLFKGSGVPSPRYGANVHSDSEVFHSDATGNTRKYPAALNTWLSPSIGVMPEASLAPNDNGKGFQKTTPTIMGLEQDGTGVGGRGIYVTRASFAKYITNAHTFAPGGVNVADMQAGHTLAGVIFYYSSPGNAVGGSVFDENDPQWNFASVWLSTFGRQGDLIAIGSDIWQATGTGVSGNVGSLAGSPPRFYDPINDVSWALDNVGSDGGPMAGYSDSSQTTSGAYGTITITNGVASDISDAPGVLYGDQMLINFSDPPVAGEYAPLIAGRADSDGGPLPVQLGGLQVGDTLMFAVDATPNTTFDDGSGGGTFAISGLLYVGKNKQWFTRLDNSAPFWTSPSPAVDTKNFDPKIHWAATLDPQFSEEAPDDPVSYYPAVSWRMGGIHLRFRVGQAVKFPPPKGFIPLSIEGVKEITIPIA